MPVIMTLPTGSQALKQRAQMQDSSELGGVVYGAGEGTEDLATCVWCRQQGSIEK